MAHHRIPGATALSITSLIAGALETGAASYASFRSNLNQFDDWINWQNEQTDNTPNPDYGGDSDGDGDHDQWDDAHQEVIESGFPQFDEAHVNIDIMNGLTEFIEDVAELYDGSSANDSFFDGGNGSGNETPTPD
jgi:hypothetical protein